MVRALIAGLFAAATASGAAFPGAWPQPEDSVLVITTTGRQVAPVGAIFGDPAEREKNTTQIFIEYGFNPDLTVGFMAYSEFSTTDDILEARIGGHVRHRIWSGTEGDIMSLQAGASFPVERWLGNGLGDSRPDSASEVDLRVLYGRGWQGDWGDSFVSSELGLRIRGEGLDEEVRADITLGHTPTDGFLGLLSLFTVVPLGQQTEYSFKIGPSIAYTMWPILGSNDKKPEGPLYPNTIQLGIVWDALQPEDGLTLQVGVWKRF
ncbi:MAG: hypothetical protein AAF409_13965 [Pseudomonadota bacterium]